MKPRSEEQIVKNIDVKVVENMKAPKNMNIKKTIVLGLIASTTLILSACGELNTDPLASNPEYKGMAQSFNEESDVKEQKFQDFSFVNQIFPAPKTAGALVFVEGKEKSYKMNIPVLQDGIEYVIGTKGLPAGAGFTKVKGSIDEYELTWTPEAGYASNKEDYGTVKFMVSLKVTKAADKQTEDLLKLVAMDHELEIVIVKAPALPEGN